jgi:hypothetical protein
LTKTRRYSEVRITVFHMAVSESILGHKAGEAIRRGQVPSRAPDRIIGGPGTGALCCVCGEPVMHHMTQLELEFNHNGAAPDVAIFRLHHRCFAAWEFERTKVDAA